MSEYFLSFFSLFFSDQNQLWLMFFSAFSSATLLPGNSEIVFSSLIAQSQIGSNLPLALFAMATLGNSLGSFTTYAMARLLPELRFNVDQKMAKWAIAYSQKYGVFMLLLSWMPVVGDILCGVAGWLRLNIWLSLFFITLAKAARYAVLWWSVATFFG